ncbi:reverse transcriptase domain-containing protein [Tanacetum coccineum]
MEDKDDVEAAEEESNRKANEEAAKAQADKEAAKSLAEKEEATKKAAEESAMKKAVKKEAKAAQEEAKKKSDQEAAIKEAAEQEAKATHEERKEKSQRRSCVESGDGVATIKQRRHDIHGDGVRDTATASGRARLKNESVAIAGRNLFDDEASSSNNTGVKSSTPPKTLHEHSHPNSSGFQTPIAHLAEQTGGIIDARDILLIQGTCTFQGLKNEDPIRHVKHYLRAAEKEGHEGAGPSITHNEEPASRPFIFYQPSKSSNLPFSSRVKKQKKDDEDERLLSIFKWIHINLPFLEAMIHMPKGAKVLKDLLSHKEKLEKATFLVKLSEECSVIIQMSLPQKGDPGSFTLPCLIGTLEVKNALTDLGASINLMPHSLFRRLGISKLKPTKMSIQLADRSIKYPIGVCENLLVKVSKFIFIVDFVVLEIDEDELVVIILGWPFLATTRVIIDVYEGKLSLRVGSETVTFNIGKSMKSKYYRDDYLYYADHTAKLV